MKKFIYKRWKLIAAIVVLVSILAISQVSKPRVAHNSASLIPTAIPSVIPTITNKPTRYWLDESYRGTPRLVSMKKDGGLLKSNEYYELLKKQIEGDKLSADVWFQSKCNEFWIFDDEEDKQIQIERHGYHADGCPGDPNFAPRMDTFIIDKTTKEIQWLDIGRNKEIPYIEWAKGITKSQNQEDSSLEKSENITWLVGNKKIVFQFKKNPYPGSDSSDIVTITATDHPKLFENLDYNVIKVTPFNDGARALYLISNVFYQAAGYTPHHAIVIDIWRDGAVQYETSDLNTQGWFHNITVIGDGELKSTFVYGAYDFCRSCGYYLTEYLSYAGPKKGFLTNNTAHKEEFKKMLDDINRNNHCAVVAGGEQLTFEEIKKQYGEEYRCRASAANMRMKGTNPKQYFALKDKVTRIIKGEELSLLNNDL